MTAAIHVRGEDAPGWLAALLAALGVAMASASVVLFERSAEGAPVVVLPVSTPVVEVVPPSAPVVDAPAQARPCPPTVLAFGLAASALDANARDAADAIAVWVTARPEATVLVHGHADALGSDAANLALSKARASAVADRLAAQGVSRARITVRGFGAYQPVEGAAEEAADNRRVAVYVRSEGECLGGTR